MPRCGHVVAQAQHVALGARIVDQIAGRRPRRDVDVRSGSPLLEADQRADAAGAAQPVADGANRASTESTVVRRMGLRSAAASRRFMRCAHAPPSGTSSRAYPAAHTAQGSAKSRLFRAPAEPDRTLSAFCALPDRSAAAVDLTPEHPLRTVSSLCHAACSVPAATTRSASLTRSSSRVPASTTSDVDRARAAQAPPGRVHRRRRARASRRSRSTRCTPRASAATSSRCRRTRGSSSARWRSRKYERIRGLSPTIAIEQKTRVVEPALDGRHDHRDLRLPARALRARRRAALPPVRRPGRRAHRRPRSSTSSPRCPTRRQVTLLAPKAENRKGEFRELFDERARPASSRVRDRRHDRPARGRRRRSRSRRSTRSSS